MIETSSLIAFIAASATLIVIPGPNVAVLVATGAAHGRRASLTVLAGMLIAQLVQIPLVVAGLAALIATFGWALMAMKWIGAAYLAYLGITALLTRAGGENARPVSSRQLFATGALTAFANPKSLAFHAAFLPLFVSPGGSEAAQLFVLGAIYLTLALIIDGGYALLAGSAKPLFERYSLHAAAHKASGAVMLGAAAWLAARRAQ